MSVLVGLGEPSACSIGGGVFGVFVDGARGTLPDFFCVVLELDRFLSAIGFRRTINGRRKRRKGDRRSYANSSPLRCSLRNSFGGRAGVSRSEEHTAEL